MPPARKYQKEEIIQVAYEIVKSEGFNSINARRIAQQLHASVVPIFHNFTSMEELKKEVYERIYQTYQQYMMNKANNENSYQQMGLSYIRFAKEQPEFFKILFMQKTDKKPETFIISAKMGDKIIAEGQKLTGLSYEKQKQFHVKVWIFTHGIATLVATNTVKLSDLEIKQLLQNTVREMLIGYRKETQ